jgi:hypothetical protein
VSISPPKRWLLINNQIPTSFSPLLKARASGGVLETGDKCHVVVCIEGEKYVYSIADADSRDSKWLSNEVAHFIEEQRKIMISGNAVVF